MKIGIVHYRVGRTDGVSFEVEKRKQVLEEMGHEVHLVAGHFSNGTDYIIPELEVELPEVTEIKEHAWSSFNREPMDPDDLMRRIDKVSAITKRQFMKYHYKKEFDLLLVHNIFSFSLHIAAAKAFAEIITEHRIPALATNHDYYWERGAYACPSNQRVQEFLDTYVPYESDLIKYISINSLAARELKRRRGIDSDVVGDFLDFSQSYWIKDAYNSTWPRDMDLSENDLVILQATRIVPRKGIEIACDLARRLQDNMPALAGRTLYNGKKITPHSRIVLVLAGYTEPYDLPYQRKLEQKIARLGITARFINNLVDAERHPGSRKIYSLWDCYAHADLVTYPSLIEGWGNQLIEAVFAKKPVALFEYPVFKSDIKKEGYFYISLGGEITGRDEEGLVKISDSALSRAANQVRSALLDEYSNARLDHNFNVGRKYHDVSLLRDYLNKNINNMLLAHVQNG